MSRHAVSSYLIFIAFLFLLSFVPHLRVWGLTWWAYYPLWVRVAFLAIWLLAGCLVWMWHGRHQASPEETGQRHDLLIVILMVTFAAAFVLLRARMHFLGDGYQLLGTLASDQPYLKSRNLGGMLLPYAIMLFVGTPGRETALVAYQSVSVACGLAFLWLAWVASKYISNGVSRRLFCWLGLVTGGYALLFFGYVENYAPFAVSVLGFTLVGLAVAEGQLSRWWLLPAFGVTVFFHLFGLALLPAAVYQFVQVAPRNSMWRRQSYRRALWLGGIVVIVAGLGWLATHNLFVRFALLWPVATRFTVDGYTLFSWHHLVDWLNLVILLVPGLVIIWSLLTRKHMKRYWRRISGRFLILSTLCLLAVAFIMDPKLGMPRDWDLFACAGIPLALLAYHFIMRTSPSHDRLLAALTILSASAVLLPRVIAQTIPSVAIEHARTYIEYDAARSWTFAPTVLEQVTQHQGKPAAQEQMLAWRGRWQDRALVDTGVAYADIGKHRESARYQERAIRINPMNHNAWANLGSALISQGKYDSALGVLAIARGINPRMAIPYVNEGCVYLAKKHYREAEQQLLKGRALDRQTVEAPLYLIMLYNETSNAVARDAYIDTVLQFEKVNWQHMEVIGTYLVQRGMYPKAEVALRRALASGMDTLAIDNLLAQYPSFRDYWRRATSVP